ncbi:hypothetical protein Taro_011359 [Colocasia esculenta]|uniref:Cyclin N-terminal domain-containing protein n=1 Tax=Colocasia esculenta TaxID=4460 RepID=A0A843U627_COLES|nr:hypothetical protein [Colocasia esculenta]
MSPERAPVAKSRAKRMLQMVTYTKLRPKSPSRKRPRLPPGVDGGSTAPAAEVDCDEEAALSILDEASSSSSCFASEVTFESGTFFAESKNPKTLMSSASHQKSAEKAEGDRLKEGFRRITRSYAKQKEKLRTVDAKGGSRDGRFSFPADPSYSAGDSMHRQVSTGKTDNSVGNAFSGLTTSEMSHVSGELTNGNLKEVTGSRKRHREAPEISDSSCHESVSVTKAREFHEFRLLEQGDRLECEVDLACSEFLSNSEESPGNSSCKDLTLSELGSDLLDEISGFSGHSSFALESPDDCVERFRKNSAPSFLPLFLRLGLEFSRSSSHKAPSGIGDEYAHEFTLMRFEDTDDEENYQRFRSRERRQALLYDYTEEYSSETEHGDLIIQQRLVMVNWMVEHASAEELHCETLFLGVGLMDRFLSRGFFKTEGNLHLLGIACVTLAARLEENQPYNCVRRKFFYVGGNTYGRSEVVAMEWFVQEVLNFQCLHLTTFNFLWFYLKAAKADETVENLAKYLAVLSLPDHERLSFWPSTVAAGLVILASLATDHDSSCNWVMETHVRTKNDDLSECIQETLVGVNKRKRACPASSVGNLVLLILWLHNGRLS